MTMTVETGAIVAGANSYATEAALDSYWTDRNVSLSSYSTAEKEAALIIATQYVDNNYEYRGTLADEDQPLVWPRSFVVDARGRSYDANEIPQILKNAVFEYAYRELTNADGLQPDVDDTGELISKSTNLGGELVVSKSYRPGSGGYYGKRRYPQADKWLKPLIKQSMTLLSR